MWQVIEMYRKQKKNSLSPEILYENVIEGHVSMKWKSCIINAIQKKIVACELPGRIKQKGEKKLKVTPVN
jgi:hypothetical protein